MKYSAWPQVRGDLMSTRQRAAVFLDSLPVQDIHRAIGRENWIARWTKSGDANCVLAELNIEKGAFDEAAEAWLCALTAFEVARRLVDEGDPQGRVVSTKVEAVVQRVLLLLERKVERVQIESYDEAGFPGYYLPARRLNSYSPAVICISSEQETGAMLFGRLLPLLIGGGMSALVVSHEDVSNHSLGQSEILLSNCLDFLSAQAGVDATRIGVYGDGLSAVLVTDFAVFDDRVAAAVCDGGLWNWVRTLASVGWMTRTADMVDEDVMSVRRPRLARQLRCPILVVAGGRGVVSLPEAINLRADCAASRIDLQLTVPRVTKTPVGDIENFVTSDQHIFGWLQHKLATVQLHKRDGRNGGNDIINTIDLGATR